MVEVRPQPSALIWIAHAMLLVAAIAVAGCRGPRQTSADDRQVREALLAELQPVTLENCILGRFGSRNDGGYLMCKNLIDGVEAAYSYGVVPDDDWGCDVSTRYQLPVHQYDCLAPAQPLCPSGKFIFHEQCLGDRTQTVGSRTFDTLANQLSANGHGGKRVVLKIDVEGAEWDALMATPDAVLETIDQLPMELHGVNERRFLEVVQKLKRTFYLVNLHFNNHACSAAAAPLPGAVYEVLFVNKRIGVLDHDAPVPALPSRLDAPDNLTVPDCQLEIPDQEARERQVREALLAELRLVALKNCTLRRFGSANDGGYLMCGNFNERPAAGYSYGVGPNDEWGCEISTRYKVPVHQYDCFDPARPVCPTGKFVFHNECLGDRKEIIGSRLFDSLANQIAANGDAGKPLIVKIDIEGAEWDSLMATPDEVLERFDQLPMELHGVNERRFVAVLRKLKRTFYLVNLHFNNHACAPDMAPLPAVAYQVLFVNKRIGVLDEAAGTPAPSPLNAPDRVGGPDCQLEATAH